MAFADDVRRFAVKVEARQRAVFVGAVTRVHGAMTDGDPVTGAPGQPVDTGNLRASWQASFPGEWVGEITTNTEYAPAIEAGIGPHGPMTLRSAVGGFGSRALVVSNWDKLVEDTVRTTVGG